MADIVIPASGDASATAIPSFPQLYNETDFDSQRGNTEGTALASAARTSTTASSDITNYNARGVWVHWDVTAVTATPSVTFRIDMKDPVSGTYMAMLAGPSVTTVSNSYIMLYPGITEQANVKSGMALSRIFRIVVTHADADSITYSVGYSLIL